MKHLTYKEYLQTLAECIQETNDERHQYGAVSTSDNALFLCIVLDIYTNRCHQFRNTNESLTTLSNEAQLQSLYWNFSGDLESVVADKFEQRTGVLPNCYGRFTRSLVEDIQMRIGDRHASSGLHHYHISDLVQYAGDCEYTLRAKYLTALAALETE